MALSKTLETQFGITIEDCYLRVEGVSVTTSTLTFILRKYVSADKPFFDNESFTCAYDMSGDNPIKQAYEHLKTLPEFEGTTDV